MDENDAIAESHAPGGVGDRLRAARDVKGLSLEQVAAETRIPQRHLSAIEAGDFAELPGRTYAVGFARTYAKTVGLDPDEVAASVRDELDAQSGEDYRPASFEPGDPARVPSRALGWFAAMAVLLLLAGVFFFFRTMFAPAGELPSLVDQQKQAQARAQAAAAAARPATPAVASGPVTLTALDQGIWVKVYDSAHKTLMEKLMDKGESFTVPPDAQGPMLWTGRPDALAITVGGRPIAKLADVQTVMKDVPLTPAALVARTTASPPPGAPQQPASGASPAAPSPGASPGTAAPAPSPAASPTA